MEKGDLIRDLLGALKRSMALFLPGFLCTVGVGSAHGMALAPRETFGGFLGWLLLFVTTCYLAGILIQALRYATFDPLRALKRKPEIDPVSEHAWLYGMYANLATFWPLLFVAHEITREPTSWGPWAFIAGLVVFLWIEGGLILGALRAYDGASAPPAAKRSRRKTAKKTGT